METVAFRCPPELLQYVEDAAVQVGKPKTKIITDAIALDRDLAVMLKPDEARLEAFSELAGLDMDRDLADILARLVKAGLDSGRSTKK